MLPYRIGFDERNCLLTVEVYGFWDAAIATEYFRSLAPYLAIMASSGKHCDILTDLSGWTVQGGDVQDLVRQHIAGPGRGYRAFVVPSHLMRLQFLRVVPAVAGDPKTKICATRDEALSWLRKFGAAVDKGTISTS